MFAAATRAWYFPTCVRSATPVGSPIAQTPSAARSRSSTVTPFFVISTPSCSRPRFSTFGRRPVATSSRSASSVSPLERCTRTPFPAASTRSARAPRTTRIPSSSKRVHRRSPASESSRESRCSEGSTTVAAEPRRWKYCVSSTPTGPPPSTTRLSGGPSAHTASRLVQYSISSMPSIGRDRGRGAGRDDEVLVLELAAVGRYDAGASDASLAPDQLRPLVLEPARVPGVVAVARDLVAPPEDAIDRQLPGHRLGGAGRVARGLEDLGRPEQRLRRHAGVVRALAAGEPVLDDDDLDVLIEPPERADEVLAARPRPDDDDTTSHDVTLSNGGGVGGQAEA